MIVEADFDTTEWGNALSDEFARLGIVTQVAAIELADDIADRMKDTAPYDEARKAGRHARSSINSRRGTDGEGFFIDVGPTRAAFYLLFYEYGTSHQPARPFMRPAIEAAVAGWSYGL